MTLKYRDREFHSWQDLQDAAGASVGGWQTGVDREFVFDEVQKLPEGAVIVEVGVYLGGITALMALVTAIQGTKREIHAVDAWVGDGQWHGEAMRAAFCDNVAKAGKPILGHGVLDFVQIDDGHSPDVGQAWPVEKRIDFLIVDADHSYEGELGDLEAWCPHVAVGGLAVVDDTSASEVARACESFFGTAERAGKWLEVEAPRDRYPRLHGGREHEARSSYRVWRRVAE